MYLRSLQKCEMFVALLLVALVVCELEGSKLKPQKLSLPNANHSAEGAGLAIAR